MMSGGLGKGFDAKKEPFSLVQSLSCLTLATP